jgi:tol-pal system protein YbgF
MFIRRILTASAFAGALAAMTPTARAQLFERPPAPVGGGQAYPAPGQDAAGLLVRVDRLENQMRSLNGQIEQMQYQMQRLQDQLRKFQQDVDFRFDERAKPSGRGAQRRGDAADDMPAPRTDTASAAPDVIAAPSAARRGDAFDPAANPDAPGAPRRLGAPDTASRPLPNGVGAANSAIIDEDDDRSRGPGAPLDLNPLNAHGGRPRQSAAAEPSSPALPRVLPPLPQQGRAPQGPLSGAAPGHAPSGALAALPPDAGPRAEYDMAMIAYKNGHYEDAEDAFQAFLRKHPKDRLASDAVFFLGESFARRGRNREAAEQFLKVSTDYASAARAPEAMVRLGQSLEKLGMKEQACAAFGEVPHKYPNASASLRRTAEREQKRSQC